MMVFLRPARLPCTLLQCLTTCDNFFFDDNFFLLAHQAGCPASPRPNAFSTFLPPTRTSPEGSEGGFVNFLHGFDQRWNSGIVINDLTDQTLLSKVILYTQHTAPQTYVTRCELTTKRAFPNFKKNILLAPDFDNRHRQGPFTVYLESKFPGQQTLDSRPLTSDP